MMGVRYLKRPTISCMLSDIFSVFINGKKKVVILWMENLEI